MASTNLTVDAAAKSVADIAKAVQQMDRPELLRRLGLICDRKMVADVEGLHPVTLYQKSTLKIESFKVPFLHKGAAGECCTGAYISRFGHKTRSYPSTEHR